MRLAIILLGLMSCAAVRVTAPGECVTVCGMTAYETTAAECEALRDLEADVVHKVGEQVVGGAWHMCRAVNGWVIKVHDRYAEDRTGCAIGWQIVPGFCVSGYTAVETKTIEISSPNWRPSSLAHEMIHVAELESTGGKGGHCWSLELRRALSSVIGRPDLSTPEVDCP